MVCRDVYDLVDMDLNTLYACLSGTTKRRHQLFRPHLGRSVLRNAPHGRGRRGGVARGPSSRTRTASSSPDEVRRGKLHHHGKVRPDGHAGADAFGGPGRGHRPAPIALAITQAVAECLAGVVYVNAIQPGARRFSALGPSFPTFAPGSMSAAAPNRGLLTAGCAQMHHFYGLPGGAASGMTDAKLPDMQSGWEQGITNVMAGLAGSTWPMKPWGCTPR